MVGGNGGKGRKWRSVFTTCGNGQGLQDGGALIVLGSALLYMLYYRWKHGRRVARHIWKVAGYPEGFWPEPLVRPKVLGGCDPVLCADDPQELHAFQEEDDLLRRNGRIGESA